MKIRPDKYWRTDNLYLAAYLFGRGAVISGVSATSKRATFAFVDSLQRQSYHDEFRFGTPMIDARIYIVALQTLRQKRLDALISNPHGED